MSRLSRFARHLGPALTALLMAVGGSISTAQAQSAALRFTAASFEDCAARCVGGCSMAYFFRNSAVNNCRWTTDTRPNLGMHGTYQIWSGRHQSQVTVGNIATLFPQAVIEQRDLLPPALVAEAEAQLQRQSPAATDLPPADSDIVTAGADACRSRPANAGRQWIMLYGNINNARYREHRGFLCAEAGDRFFVPNVTIALERYQCSADFHDCRRDAVNDIFIGPPLGPDSNGATQRWQIIDRQTGQAFTAFVARF